MVVCVLFFSKYLEDASLQYLEKAVGVYGFAFGRSRKHSLPSVRFSVVFFFLLIACPVCFWLRCVAHRLKGCPFPVRLWTHCRREAGRRASPHAVFPLVFSQGISQIIPLTQVLCLRRRREGDCFGYRRETLLHSFGLEFTQGATAEPPDGNITLSRRTVLVSFVGTENTKFHDTSLQSDPTLKTHGFSLFLVLTLVPEAPLLCRSCLALELDGLDMFRP